MMVLFTWLLVFNNSIIFQWLRDDGAYGWKTYIYPIAFNNIFGGVQGQLSNYYASATLDTISFKQLTNTQCLGYTDNNKPNIIMFIWGI